tara:strand:+ start:1063 stop:1284 length:222 start_codon:yes stop_codon:yes gene_type:complete
MQADNKFGTYISQLMATVVESEDEFVKELALNELNRLKVNIDEFLVKHFQKDDVSEKQIEKQLLQEDKNVKDK